ncbi:MAG: hypothetical protein HGA44_06595 [Cellulomonadaceae bacterium]|nr:hypothetical protein [Cellulomonadaceae bacterium]
MGTSNGCVGSAGVPATVTVPPLLVHSQKPFPSVMLQSGTRVSGYS